LLLAASGLARIRAPGEVRWGGDLQGGEPYVFAIRAIRQAGRVRGRSGSRAGAPPRVRERFVHNDWSNLVPSLERGDFDLIVNGLEDTQALRRRILLSRPYFEFAEQLVVRRGSTLRTLDALRDIGWARWRRRSRTRSSAASGGSRIVLYGGQEEPYRDLQVGRTDAVLLDSLIAARYGLTKPDLELADGDVARGSYVIRDAQGRRGPAGRGGLRIGGIGRARRAAADLRALAAARAAGAARGSAAG